MSIPRRLLNLRKEAVPKEGSVARRRLLLPERPLSLGARALSLSLADSVFKLSPDLAQVADTSFAPLCAFYLLPIYSRPLPNDECHNISRWPLNLE